jgi:RND family efflux transporter MFP subunit
MTAETPSTTRPRSGRVASLVLPILLGAGGLYAGMRWHATFERWLAPAAANAPADSVKTESQNKKQLWTCGMHPSVIQDHPGDCPICHMKLTPVTNGASNADGNAAGMVVIDAAVVQNMGVRTAEATEGTLDQTVRVSASLTEPEYGYYDVNLRVSGWIRTLYANTDGMEVKAGDPLFELYSPDLTLAIEELISAHRAAKVAADEANPALRDTSASLVASAENRLLALDLTPSQIAEFGAMEHAPSLVAFLAPMSGHITEKAGVYAGSSVMAGQRVFRIAKWGTMWVEGRVPEGELGRVRVGQKARAKADAYPGRIFEGEVIFIHPHFDDATRTALVRMALSNHDYALHEGMYATVEIDVGDSERTTLVPREAVIDSGESQIVFVSAGKGRFEPRAVVMGRSGRHGLVQILSGIKPGERVVASGQFLLDSESRLREAVAKVLDQKPTAPAPGAPPAPSPTIAVPTAKVDAVVAAYLPLAESLGAVQKSDAPLGFDALAAAIRALHAETADPAGVRLIDAASGAAEAMKGQTLDQQRERFKTLSAAVISLVDAMPPSSSVTQSLFVLNCPMAKADWLQRTEGVANPYYAEDMKACGSVVRPVGSGRAKGGK